MRAALVLLLVLVGCSKPDKPRESRVEAPKVEESKPHELVVIEASVPAPPASGPTACTKDEECTRAPTCCPSPCPAAIHEKDVEKAIAAMHCPPDLECPSAGACRRHRYACESGKCQLVFSD